MKNNITDNTKSQVQKIFWKLEKKKRYNKNVIKWLNSIGDKNRAIKIENCATYIGIAEEENIPKIVTADFCRERLCAICAWRRQARFLAQTIPMLQIMKNNGRRFIFVTLTIKNMEYNQLSKSVDDLLLGFHKLHRLKKIKNSWVGIIRSLELTYNAERNDFHPHLHLLIDVDSDYFSNPEKYISYDELVDIWQKIMGLDYIPQIHMESVTGDENAAVETLKYALKPSTAENALSAFYYILRGRRLVSFTGTFAKMRKKLKYNDFENILTDDMKIKQYKFNLFKFDTTGGVYRFYEQYSYYD